MCVMHVLSGGVLSLAVGVVTVSTPLLLSCLLLLTTLTVKPCVCVLSSHGFA